MIRINDIDEGVVARSYTTIRVTKDEHDVVTICLARPDARNAVDGIMHGELIDVFRRVRDEPDVGAVVLTGAGPGFCAGGDMDQFARLRTGDWRWVVRELDGAVTLVRELLGVRAPVIAAVNGHAIGLGATLALAADVVVLAEDAKIGDTHIKVGVVPGDGGTALWPALVGPARAKEFLMRGSLLDAATAERIGLVGHVAPAAEVLKQAMLIARELAGGPRVAIALTKQAINTAIERDLSMSLPLALAYEARSFAQPDVGEGVSAFLERRAPAWPSGHREPPAPPIGTDSMTTNGAGGAS